MNYIVHSRQDTTRPQDVTLPDGATVVAQVPYVLIELVAEAAEGGTLTIPFRTANAQEVAAIENLEVGAVVAPSFQLISPA